MNFDGVIAEVAAKKSDGNLFRFKELKSANQG
jgi:hypothetical protein